LAEFFRLPIRLLQSPLFTGEKPVVPLGLVLSVIAVYIMLFTGWKGEEWYSARPYRYDEVQR
jgi:hypothetical protein